MSELIERLASPDADERNEAIQEAVGAADPAVADALVSLVASDEVGTPARTAAAAALAQMPGESGGEALTGLLSHDDPACRSFAASALEFRPQAETVAALLETLQDPINNVRNVAERSLLAMTDELVEHGVARLSELLDHPAPLTRSPAARLAGTAQVASTTERLCRMAVEDEEWLPRMWASRALGDMGDPELLVVLRQVVAADEKNRVRAAAVEAVGQLRAEESGDVLRAALQDGDEGVQRAAEEALAELERAGFEDEGDPFSDE